MDNETINRAITEMMGEQGHESIADRLTKLYVAGFDAGAAAARREVVDEAADSVRKIKKPDVYWDKNSSEYFVAEKRVLAILEELKDGNR